MDRLPNVEYYLYGVRKTFNFIDVTDSFIHPSQVHRVNIVTLIPATVVNKVIIEKMTWLVFSNMMVIKNS